MALIASFKKLSNQISSSLFAVDSQRTRFTVCALVTTVKCRVFEAWNAGLAAITALLPVRAGVGYARCATNASFARLAFFAPFTIIVFNAGYTLLALSFAFRTLVTGTL